MKMGIAITPIARKTVSKLTIFFISLASINIAFIAFMMAATRNRREQQQEER
jgi:hypothetical protein